MLWWLGGTGKGEICTYVYTDTFSLLFAGIIDTDYTANVNIKNAKPTKTETCSDGAGGEIKEITVTAEIIGNAEIGVPVLGWFDLSWRMFSQVIASEDVTFKYSCCCEEGEVK